MTEELYDQFNTKIQEEEQTNRFEAMVDEIWKEELLDLESLKKQKGTAA